MKLGETEIIYEGERQVMLFLLGQEHSGSLIDSFQKRFRFLWLSLRHSFIEHGSCQLNHFYHGRNHGKSMFLKLHKNQWSKRMFKCFFFFCGHLICFMAQRSKLRHLSQALLNSSIVLLLKFFFPITFLFARGKYELISCQFCEQPYFDLY